MSILKIKDNHGVWHIIKALKGKDGINLEFEWNGTKLGVKTSEEKEFKYVDLKGETGQTGATGMTGNSIKNIEKLSTKDNVDTYAVNFTDGTQTTFNVTNGEVSLDELKEVNNKVESNYEEIENLKSELLATNEVRDSFINVGDSYKEQLLNLSIDGVLKQTATTGKQLFNIKNITQGRYIDESGNILNNPNWNISLENIDVIANEEYTFSRNNLEINESQFLICEYKSNGDFIKQNQLWQKGTYKYTITTTSETKFVHLGYRNDFAHSDLMFQKGTDRTQFEPYTGGQPSPSPDYPQEIETITGNFSLTSCNKNLFNKNKPNILNAYISGVDGEIGSDNVTSIFVKCKQNTNYTISKIVSSRFIVGTTSVKPQNKVICNSFKRNDNVTNITISTNSNDKYLIVYVLNSKDELILNKIFDSLQIEESLTVTSFEEHLQSQITVNLPEGEFIGKFDENYKDELVAVYNQEEEQYHLMLNKMIGKKVVDGNIGSVAKIGDNYFGIDNAIKNFLQFSDFTIDNNKNNKYVTLAQTSSNIQFFSISKDYNYAMNFTCGMSHNNIRIKDIRLNTVDEFKQSLNEKPMEVYYILNLNSRYSLDLGSIDMLKTYEGVTNIFTDSDLLPSIQIKYYKNFKETIKELKINEKSLKDELQSLSERLSALEAKQVVSSDDSNVEKEVIS